MDALTLHKIRNTQANQEREQIIAAFGNVNITTYTNHGVSHYFDWCGRQVRISDHSTGTNRIVTETQFIGIPTLFQLAAKVAQSRGNSYTRVERKSFAEMPEFVAKKHYGNNFVSAEKIGERATKKGGTVDQLIVTIAQPTFKGCAILHNLFNN